MLGDVGISRSCREMIKLLLETDHTVNEAPRDSAYFRTHTLLCLYLIGVGDYARGFSKP